MFTSFSPPAGLGLNIKRILIVRPPDGPRSSPLDAVILSTCAPETICHAGTANLMNAWHRDAMLCSPCSVGPLGDPLCGCGLVASFTCWGPGRFAVGRLIGPGLRRAQLAGGSARARVAHDTRGRPIRPCRGQRCARGRPTLRWLATEFRRWAVLCPAQPRAAPGRLSADNATATDRRSWKAAGSW
jgi:hypothetical protein